MRKTRSWVRTAALGGLISLLAGMATPQSAQAASGADPSSNLSRFAPTEGSVVAQRDSVGRFYIRATFFWDNNARLNNLRNSDNDAYEHETNFGGGGCFPDGGYGGLFSTNIPSAYIDTPLDDDESVQRSRSAGAGNSNAIASATEYFYSYLVNHRCGTLASIEGTYMKVGSQDSHRDERFCDAGFENCVFSNAGSPRDVVPYTAGWHPRANGPRYDWRLNRLSNESFESGGGAWSTAAVSGSVNSVVLTGNQPFEKLNHARFNCGAGAAGCKMFQRISFPVDPRDTFRNEVALRCPVAYPSCPVRLAVTTLGANGPETVQLRYTVPADNVWHYYGLLARDYRANSSVEFAVYNDTSSQHLDLDMTTLHWSDNIASLRAPQ